MRLEELVEKLNQEFEIKAYGADPAFKRFLPAAMENQARRELAPYPRFDVTSIRVYELNTEKKQYEPLIDLPLHTG